MEIMMTYFYAQLDDSGIAKAVTQTSEPVPGDFLIPLPSYDLSVLGKRFDHALSVWKDLPSSPALTSRRVSVLGFRRRFTRAERAAIEWAAVDRADLPLTLRQQAAALRATLADQAAATFIDLADPDTVEGVQRLGAMALLTPARALEIINAPIQPEEHP